MSEAVELRHLSPGALHLGRMDEWAPDLTDKRLKTAIFSDVRFADRIVADLFGVGAANLPAVRDEFETLTDQLDLLRKPERLRRIGLCWMAPRMVHALLDKRKRDICGTLGPEDVADIMAFRDHAQMDSLPPLPEPEGLVNEGKLCLISWLLSKPDLSAKRLLMQFPPTDYEGVAVEDQRALVFSACLKRFSVEQ